MQSQYLYSNAFVFPHPTTHPNINLYDLQKNLFYFWLFRVSLLNFIVVPPWDLGIDFIVLGHFVVFTKLIGKFSSAIKEYYYNFWVWFLPLIEIKFL